MLALERVCITLCNCYLDSDWNWKHLVFYRYLDQETGTCPGKLGRLFIVLLNIRLELFTSLSFRGFLLTTESGRRMAENSRERVRPSQEKRGESWDMAKRDWAKEETMWEQTKCMFLLCKLATLRQHVARWRCRCCVWSTPPTENANEWERITRPTVTLIVDKWVSCLSLTANDT